MSTGGSNSISISKANLPNVKLKVDNFSLTTASHSHMVRGRYFGFPRDGYDYRDDKAYGYLTVLQGETGSYQKDTFGGGGQNTGTASPSTEVLGSGTALIIQPAYITLKFWKRLT